MKIYQSITMTSNSDYNYRFCKDPINWHYDRFLGHFKNINGSTFIDSFKGVKIYG